MSPLLWDLYYLRFGSSYDNGLSDCLRDLLGLFNFLRSGVLARLVSHRDFNSLTFFLLERRALRFFYCSNRFVCRLSGLQLLFFILFVRNRGHFLNCILSCAFLLDFLLSLVALINHLGGWSSVLSDGKPVRKGADFSEPRWDRVLGAEAGQVLGQRRVLVLSCDCRLYGSGVFTNKTLLHGKHVVHARVSSLLKHLLLSFQMSLAGYES